MTRPSDDELRGAFHAIDDAWDDARIADGARSLDDARRRRRTVRRIAGGAVGLTSMALVSLFSGLGVDGRDSGGVWAEAEPLPSAAPAGDVYASPEPAPGGTYGPPAPPAPGMTYEEAVRLIPLGYMSEEMLEDLPSEADFYDLAPAPSFSDPRETPRSTFSVDVDTASYSNIRRSILEGRLPAPHLVRIEEMLNYFDYDAPAPRGDIPVAVGSELGACPWAPGSRLVRVGLSTARVDDAERPALNLVFLVDVSGSMGTPEKLPLLQQSLTLLTEKLRPIDRVAIVTYAGGAGLLLPPTDGGQRRRIRDAITALRAGGSTHGSAGIREAYRVARRHFDPRGVNRVVLATDGDFNVGVTSRAQLEAIIANERRSGVYLSVLGFGRAGTNDATMETLADHGNGNYAYVDTLAEARRALVTQLGATLSIAAEDVKVQVTFDPSEVSRYRLIGYDNRRLQDRDFDDDTRDAGDMGPGHQVTALYEVVPRRDTLGASFMHVGVRFKRPAHRASERIDHIVSPRPLPRASRDFDRATAIAAFGMWLRGDRRVSQSVLVRAQSLLSRHVRGSAEERELQFLIERAQSLRPRH